MGWSVREEPSELAGHRQSRKKSLNDQIQEFNLGQLKKEQGEHT